MRSDITCDLPERSPVVRTRKWEIQFRSSPSDTAAARIRFMALLAYKCDVVTVLLTPLANWVNSVEGNHSASGLGKTHPLRRSVPHLLYCDPLRAMVKIFLYQRVSGSPEDTPICEGELTDAEREGPRLVLAARRILKRECPGLYPVAAFIELIDSPLTVDDDGNIRVVFRYNRGSGGAGAQEDPGGAVAALPRLLAITEATHELVKSSLQREFPPAVPPTHRPSAADDDYAALCRLLERYGGTLAASTHRSKSSQTVPKTPCVVCGTGDDVATAHIVKNKASLLLLKISNFSSRCYVRLCGREGMRPTCHDAYDTGAITLLPTDDRTVCRVRLNRSDVLYGSNPKYVALDGREVSTPTEPHSIPLILHAAKFFPTFRVELAFRVGSPPPDDALPPVGPPPGATSGSSPADGDSAGGASTCLS